MVALRRVLIVILVLIVPAILTGLLYWASLALLAATNRVIDPDTIHWISGIAFVVLFFIAILDARARW